jgi:hypothetical protein
MSDINAALKPVTAVSVLCTLSIAKRCKFKASPTFRECPTTLYPQAGSNEPEPQPDYDCYKGYQFVEFSEIPKWFSRSTNAHCTSDDSPARCGRVIISV